MRKSPVVAGLLLIVAGLSMFFLRDVVETRVLMFLLIGTAFIAAFFYEREYGFLVPGGIMVGLGLGLVAENYMSLPFENPTATGLGAGFLLIWALDTMVTRTGGWWPLVPGGILVIVGSGFMVDGVRWVFRDGWPLVLVALGILLVARGLMGKEGPSLSVEDIQAEVDPFKGTGASSDSD
ncbi:MAG: hypothetical protein GKS06_09055 [Acidobacteria bacterium]|nr:hypothetical protein [Acidobacteriota bacterium]